MRIRRRADRRASLTRRAGFVLLLGLLTTVAPLLRPESVSAASGVDDYPSRLKNAAQDSLVDPWQFYNRECTSLVAWRLNSENGVAFDDYWQGQHWGNASNWANAARALDIPVDDHPTRGAVAWWRAGSAGSSIGHVAWVQTVGDGAITVEEYNYLHRGFYDTRTISRASSLWPSGFIHIKDTQIRNTASPTVTGTAQVGQKLKTTRGTWSAKHLTFKYQWLADGNADQGRHREDLQARCRPGRPQDPGQGHRREVRRPLRDGEVRGDRQRGQGRVRGEVRPRHRGQGAGRPPTRREPWLPGARSGTFTYQWYAGGDPISRSDRRVVHPDSQAAGQRPEGTGHRQCPRLQDQADDDRPDRRRRPGSVHGQDSPPAVSGVAQVDQPLTATPGLWNPPGKITYQWLVDGQDVKGATGTGFTPKPGDLRKPIAIQVTVHKNGYDDAVVTSAADRRRRSRHLPEHRSPRRSPARPAWASR